MAVELRERSGDRVVMHARIGALGYHRYLPFTLPAGVRRIRVRAAASRAAKFGLGLFDPRGPGYQSPGFRGVAGAERTEIVLGVDESTPGFLSGPLEPGEWTVVLPVFAAWPGTSVRVEVSWRRGSARAQPIPDVPETLSETPRWYRGDLHCHTTASSDAWATGASLGVGEWVDLARRHRLDFLAMTDHNTVAQNRHLHAGGRDVLLLAGEEMTNWFHGHALVVGLPSAQMWLDWRQRPQLLPRLRYEQRIGEFLTAVRVFGAFSAAAHPYIGLRSWQFMLDGMLDATLLPDGIEVWNSRFTSADRIALRYWDMLLRRGRHVTAVGGSDLHRADARDARAGTPTTIVGAASLSRSAIVDALKAGRATLSAGRDGPELFVEAEGPDGQYATAGDTVYGRDSDEVRIRLHARRAAGTELALISEGGRRTVAGALAEHETVELTRTIGAGGYLRFELRQGWQTAVVALTNPVFFRRGRPPEQSLPSPPPPPPPAVR